MAAPLFQPGPSSSGWQPAARSEITAKFILTDPENVSYWDYLKDLCEMSRRVAPVGSFAVL